MPSEARSGGGSAVPLDYDESAWPICVVRPPSPSLGPADFRAHLDNVERAFARGEPFGLLVDARGGRPLTAVQRQMVAARVRDNYERHPELLKGLAIVLNSSLQRGIFTAVNWIARPPYATSAFGGLSEAKIWLTGLIPRTPLGRG